MKKNENVQPFIELFGTSSKCILIGNQIHYLLVTVRNLTNALPKGQAFAKVIFLIIPVESKNNTTIAVNTNLILRKHTTTSSY